MKYTSKITRKRLKLFLEKHKSDEVALDLGSGNKRYISLFPNITSVDIDPQREPDIVGDAHNLPLASDSFTLVLCIEMLEHVQDPKQVISEIYRILKPGGKVILTTRFVFPFHDAPGDYWRFTRTGLKFLFLNWNQVTIEDEAQTFETIGILLQRIGFQTRLKCDVFLRQIIFIVAKLLPYLDKIVLEKHGEGKGGKHVPHFMSSGYYVVAYKPKNNDDND